MTRYRFVTARRNGKWYPSLAQAQAFANAIGAGFLDRRTGRLVADAGTKLEERDFS